MWKRVVTRMYDGVLLFYGDVRVSSDLSIASLSKREVTGFLDLRCVERLETDEKTNTIHIHVKGYRTFTMRSIREDEKQHNLFLRDGTRWIESISRTWKDVGKSKKSGRKLLSNALRNRTYSNTPYCAKWISTFDKSNDYERYRALRDRLKLAQSTDRHGFTVVAEKKMKNKNREKMENEDAETGGVGIFVTNSMRLLEEIDYMASACAQQDRDDILRIFLKHFHEILMLNYETFTHDDVLNIRKRGQSVVSKPSLKLDLEDLKLLLYFCDRYVELIGTSLFFFQKYNL
jgi:hypothetical protein